MFSGQGQEKGPTDARGPVASSRDDIPKAGSLSSLIPVHLPPVPGGLKASRPAAENKTEEDASPQFIDSIDRVIFNEPDSRENQILDESQHLKAATFAKIIERLTHPDIYDSDFLYDFVLTYRSFATPNMVLLAMEKRFITAPTQSKKAIWLRLLNFLKHWIEHYWYDFSRDCPALESTFLHLLEVCSKHSEVQAIASSLGDKFRRNLARDKNQPRVAIPIYSTTSKELSFLKVSVRSVAEQLTLIEWEIWSQIQPWECLGLSWTKKERETLSPNVIKLIARFNQVSGWVATTICTQASLKKRVKHMQRFIELAMTLRDMGNYNALMEVMSGLNQGPVYRLRLTWDNLGTPFRKTYEQLSTIVDRSKSYANMRQRLRQTNPPLIPYLGIYLTDLIFIDEGNKDMVNNLINWYKRHLISETIRAIKQYQLMPYQIDRVYPLRNQLFSMFSIEQDELYACSEWLEPRAGKERGAQPPYIKQKLRGGAPATSASSDSGSAVGAAESGRAAGDGYGERDRDLDPESEAAPDFEIPLHSLVAFEPNDPFGVPDGPDVLIMDTATNAIVAATLPKIIDRLTHHSYPDTSGINVFLATFELFASSAQVLDLMIQRFHVPPPLDHSKQGESKYLYEILTPIRFRIFNLLKVWVQLYFYWFVYDAALLERLKTFISGSLQEYKPSFAQSLNGLIERYEQSGNGDNDSLNTSSQPAGAAPATVYDISNEELVEHFACRLQTLLAEVHAPELIGAAKNNALRLLMSAVLVTESGPAAATKQSANCSDSAPATATTSTTTAARKRANSAMGRTAVASRSLIDSPSRNPMPGASGSSKAPSSAMLANSGPNAGAIASNSSFLGSATAEATGSTPDFSSGHATLPPSHLAPSLDAERIQNLVHLPATILELLPVSLPNLRAYYMEYNRILLFVQFELSTALETCLQRAPTPEAIGRIDKWFNVARVAYLKHYAILSHAIFAAIYHVAVTSNEGGPDLRAKPISRLVLGSLFDFFYVKLAQVMLFSGVHPDPVAQPEANASGTPFIHQIIYNLSSVRHALSTVVDAKTGLVNFETCRTICEILEPLNNLQKQQRPSSTRGDTSSSAHRRLIQDHLDAVTKPDAEAALQRLRVRTQGGGDLSPHFEAKAAAALVTWINKNAQKSSLSKATAASTPALASVFTSAAFLPAPTPPASPAPAPPALADSGDEIAPPTASTTQQPLWRPTTPPPAPPRQVSPKVMRTSMSNQDALRCRIVESEPALLGVARTALTQFARCFPQVRADAERVVAGAIDLDDPRAFSCFNQAMTRPSTSSRDAAMQPELFSTQYTYGNTPTDEFARPRPLTTSSRTIIVASPIAPAPSTTIDFEAWRERVLHDIYPRFAMQRPISFRDPFDGRSREIRVLRINFQRQVLVASFQDIQAQHIKPLQDALDIHKGHFPTQKISLLLFVREAVPSDIQKKLKHAGVCYNVMEGGDAYNSP